MCKSIRSVKGFIYFLSIVLWGWERLECISWLRTRIQFGASDIRDIGEKGDDWGARMAGRLRSKHQMRD